MADSDESDLFEKLFMEEHVQYDELFDFSGM